LLASGRLETLLRTGGVTVADDLPPADDARRAARRAELGRVLGREDRRAGALAAPGRAPCALPDVLAELALPSPPRLERRTAARGRVTTLAWRFALAERHGDWPHRAALTAPTADLAAALRDERLSAFSVRDTLFLDIESTGLSHGAGTYAFLVGLAWFEGEELHLEQIFLEDPGDEAALLDHFGERRASRPFLASFNGRCYDVHVLQSRLVLNRCCDEHTSALRLLPHVDLLHFARAVHGGCYDNNRLQTLELPLLGFRREAGDVPGELIPGLYFQYLQTGDVAPLAPVFRHNAWDVLSMVALYAHLCALVARDGAPPEPAGGGARAPTSQDHGGAGGDPTVALNLGRLWLSRGDAARAERALTAPLAEGHALSAAALCRGLTDLATALKRRLRDGGAGPDGPARLARVLTRLAAVTPAAPEPHVELSRLHERLLPDPAAALRHAELALERLPPTASPAERAVATRRVERLARRLRPPNAGPRSTTARVGSGRSIDAAGPG
jgi:uncharacterized protein YprB with RNaseH-like and TPR domain